MCQYNTNALSNTSRPQVKISGSYYRYAGGATVATTVNSRIGGVFVLEPAEILSVNCTRAGVNIFARLIEFDSYASIKTVKILGTSIINGDNTLYTVPAGKTALVLGTNYQATDKGVFYCNTATGTNLISYAVPNGGSKGTGNQCSPSTFTSTNTLVNLATNPCMNTGDSILINSDTGGAASWMLWATVIEI